MDVSCQLEPRLSNKQKPWFAGLAYFPGITIPTNFKLLLLSHISHVRLCATPYSSPPGSPIPGILQARTLEWVAISFSNARKWKVKVKSLSRVRLLATPWTAAHQAPPSTEVSRQEYWSGSPVPSPIYIYRLKIIHFCHQLLSTCVCTIHGYLCDMKINKTWKL